MTGETDSAEAGDARRRGRTFHHAGGAIARRLGRAAAERGFAEPDVLLRWPEIVGPDLAGRCLPVRVSYGTRGGLGATLTVQASGARAPEVDMLAPAIVERVNQYYGYRAIARLRITQATAAGGFAEGQAAFAPAPKPGRSDRYDGAALSRARAMTDGIESPGLRDALTRLGARVLAGRGGRSRP